MLADFVNLIEHSPDSCFLPPQAKLTGASLSARVVSSLCKKPVSMFSKCLTISLSLLPLQLQKLPWDFRSFHTFSLHESTFSPIFDLTRCLSSVFFSSCVPLYHPLLPLHSLLPSCGSLRFHVFCMYVILLSTVFSCFFIPSVFPSFLPSSCSSSHPFFLASPPLSCLFYSISLLVYFLPIIDDCFVAPSALIVTFHPSFNLSFRGWSIRSRCPGGR